MKSIIYIYSYHHGNTRKVADAMADVLACDIIQVDETTPRDVSEFDLIGLGAGIAFSKHYRQLLEFAERLPSVEGKRAFIFSTAGLHSDKWMRRHHAKLKQILGDKGYNIVGQFACKGYDTFGALKVIGGINRGRPNEDDLARATDFATGLRGEGK